MLFSMWWSDSLRRSTLCCRPIRARLFWPIGGRTWLENCSWLDCSPITGTGCWPMGLWYWMNFWPLGFKSMLDFRYCFDFWPMDVRFSLIIFRPMTVDPFITIDEEGRISLFTSLGIEARTICCCGWSLRFGFTSIGGWRMEWLEEVTGMCSGRIDCVLSWLLK